MDLDTKITEVKNIGPYYQKRLKKLGIERVRDLIFHFPRRYNDFSNIIPISEIHPVRKTEKSSQPPLPKISNGVKINEECCITGKILEIKNVRTFRRRMVLTKAIVEDKTGAIKVIWFNQPYLTNVLKKGDGVCLAGKATLTKGGIYLQNPVYEKIAKVGSATSDLLTHTGRIVPVYPETEGLSSRWLRFILKPLLVKLKDKIKDPLPEKIRKENNFLPIKKAIFQVHFPDSMKLAQEAKKRFSFEELFLIELFVLGEKIRITKEKAQKIPLKEALIKDFVQGLPFQLTPSQRKSAFEILKDLEKDYPMNRLLEGDVGSGKTIVATIVALNVAKTGHQVAFMAPTEILARQHFKTLTKLLQNFKLNIGLLTGKEDKFSSKKLKNQFIEISREKLLKKVKNGEIDILIGTHALIQKQVKFKDLALVIVDEQHRFGVKQRAKLIAHRSTRTGKQINTDIFIPHLLSMTATPIPRTLALTIYGDLDLSLLKEMPKGRKTIITKVVRPINRKDAYNFIRNQVKKGRQVFVICPRIEPSTKAELGAGQASQSSRRINSWTEVKAVKEEYEKLSKKVFPDLKVAQLHGKMGVKEKKTTMEDFKKKKIDVLVSTSVIEVGIDVPDATVMMIEGAERFGLSQLHQFRGRVGRSHFQSFCFLFTDSPSRNTKSRLKALLNSNTGFELAEKDLKIRGPGDFFGTRQWGIPDLAMEALKNIRLVEKVRKTAKEILEKDPELRKYPELRARLEKFKERVHLE